MSRKTRKLIWSAPLVGVLAVAGALAMFVALSPGGAMAEHVEILDAPTNLTAKAADGQPGRTTMALSWTPPSGPVDGYRIDVTTDNVQWMELLADTGNADTTYMHMGLSPAMQRTYRVFALNSAGTGFVSNTSQGRTSGAAMPDDVIGLTATPNGWHKIDLNWTEPYGGGKKIEKYCIEVATPDAGFPASPCTAATTPITASIGVDGSGTIVTSSAATTYTQEELDAGTTRLYRVYAITGAGASDISEEPSNIATARTALAVNPLPPSELTLAKNQPAGADLNTNTMVDLYWYWPSSDGGVDITGFRVEVTTDRNNWPSSTDTSDDNPDIMLGADTPDVNAVLATVEANVARSPTLAYQAQHDHGVSETNEADPPVIVPTRLHYRVFTETDSDVDAEGGERRSSPSAIGSIIVNGGENPYTPTFLEGGVDPNGTSLIALEWDAGDTDAVTSGIQAYEGSGYRIDYAEGDGATGDTNDLLEWKLLWPHTNFTSPEFTHKDLDPETEVYYRIFAFGPSQTISPAAGPHEGITDTAGALGKISNITATANGATEINVSWDHPMDTDVADIDHYVVEMALLADTAWQAATTENTTGPATAFKHDKLTEKATWRYRVAVAATADFIVDNGTAWSDYAIATTDSAGAPSVPIGLVAEDARDSNLTNPGDRGVTLIWNAPEGPAGSVVDDYRVERQVLGEDSTYQSLSSETNSKRTAYTDFDEPDLANGEVRMYRVAAIGADGVVGEWAEVRSPVDLTHMPVSIVMAPSMVEAMVGTGTVTVTWVDSENAVGHLIMLFKADFSSYVHEAAPVGNSHTFMAVAAGDYVAVVVAYDAANKYKFGVDAVTVN